MKNYFQSKLELELSSNSKKITNDRLLYRNAWMDLMESRGPFLFMLTVQFQRSYKDGVTIPAINQLFYNMNRQLFRRKWYRRQLGFTGIVVAEQNKYRASNAGDLHFHCLLNPNSVVKSLNDEELLLTTAQVSANKLRDSQSRYMCALAGGVHISPVEHLDGVLGYLTKELDDPVSESGDQIYLLDYRGLLAGCLDQWRRRSC